MNLHLVLDIKFRAFGVDLYHTHLDKSYPVPEILAVAGARTLENYSNHGVTLTLSLEAAPASAA